jgi:hypothetical protein
MNIVAECLNNDNEMESLSDSPSFRLTSATLYGTDTQVSTRDSVISFLRDFPANPFPSQASAPEPTTSATCGPPPSNVYALFDHDTASLRTLSAFFLADTSDASSLTWLRAGMVYDGVCYRQPSWEHHIGEIDCGLWPTPSAHKTTPSGEIVNADGTPWDGMQKPHSKKTGKPIQTALTDAVARWPTPRVSDANGPQIQPNKQGGLGLNQAVNLWATPQARDYRTGHVSRKNRPQQNLNDQVGGKLNPRFVEWLMDMPEGWLSCKPLETLKWQAWQRHHGIY